MAFFGCGQIFAFEESGGVSVALFAAVRERMLSHLRGCCRMCAVDFMLGARLLRVICALNCFLFHPPLAIAPPLTQLISVKAPIFVSRSLHGFLWKLAPNQCLSCCRGENCHTAFFRLDQHQRKSLCFCFIHTKFKAMGWGL